MKRTMWIMFLILALPFAFASNEEGKIISGGNLLITDMDVKVDENSDRNLEYGEEIDDEAEPDSIVEFALRIKNNHTGFDMAVGIPLIMLESALLWNQLSKVHFDITRHIRIGTLVNSNTTSGVRHINGNGSGTDTAF
jgi:hypothetical protein